MPGLGLPGLIVKYGGSVLWAAMLFFLVAIAVPRLPRRPSFRYRP
jgi:beta-N-acetylhexosaminidase